jgi:hypothetical protein
MHGRNGFVAVFHAHLEQTGVFDEACGGNAQIARRASCDREVMTQRISCGLTGSQETPLPVARRNPQFRFRPKGMAQIRSPVQ